MNADLKLLQDVVILPAGEGKWVIHNVFARTSLGVDAVAIDTLGGIDQKGTIEGGSEIKVWEIWRFGNEQGLMADPTNFIRKVSDWPSYRTVPVSEFVEMCKQLYFVIPETTYEDYRGRFKQKNSILDNINQGDFHQCLAQHLITKLKVKPDEWWLDQKFEKEITGIQNNLYGAVQQNYLKSYLAKVFSKDDMVLDIGCGPGFYTKMMAATAGKVVGVDPSEMFIEIAKRNAPENCDFRLVSLDDEVNLADFENEKFDVVFMSDALLFYYYSPDVKKKNDIDGLLQEIRRLLKHGGRFINMEPNYTFWLQPWLGAEDAPYTVLTEYAHKKYSVTPNLTDYLRPFFRNRFVVSNVEEVFPEDKFKAVDHRAFKFASEFPLWQVYEFTKT